MLVRIALNYCIMLTDLCIELQKRYYNGGINIEAKYFINGMPFVHVAARNVV